MGLVPLPTINVGATQPISFDFTDDLAEGETIVTPTIALSVWSGTDNTPSGNLFSTITSLGAVVTQRIRPKSDALGNLYTVICRVLTSLGNTFQKQGLLAVPPATDETVNTAMNTPLGTYDSGIVSAAISPIPLLTADDNKGGLYQVNIYINLVSTSAAGVIFGWILWTDRTTSTSQSRPLAIFTTSLPNVNEDTFPIDALVGTQVLIKSEYSGVTGTPTYVLEGTITDI